MRASIFHQPETFINSGAPLLTFLALPTPYRTINNSINFTRLIIFVLQCGHKQRTKRCAIIKCKQTLFDTALYLIVANAPAFPHNYWCAMSILQFQRFAIACFTDHNDIRILVQKRTQHVCKIQTNFRLNGNLIHMVSNFHRVFNG